MEAAPPSRPAWMGLLSDDAREAAIRLETWLPEPFHVLGVERSRRSDFPALPPGPDLPEVRDVRIPVVGAEIAARLYRPSTDAELPALVYLHGGGFFLGSLDGVDALCRELASRTRSAVVSVDYRLAPEHPFPTPALDCAAAVRWVHDSAAALGIDPTRLALAGDSAGGNLALSTAVQFADEGGPALSCLVLVYPALGSESDAASWRDFADAPLINAADVAWCWSLYLSADADGDDPRAVPGRLPSLGFLPPTFVLTAEVDVLRDDAEALAARLSGEGVPTRLERYDGVYHGFFTEVGVFEATDRAIADTADFVHRHLGVD